MKKCMFCGAENSDHAEICESCGISFEYYEQGHALDEEEKKTLDANEKLKGRALLRASRSGGKGKAYPHKIGGLVACAVFTILLCHLGADRVMDEEYLGHLLCLLPGLAALHQAINVNCVEDEARQDTRENIAALLCFLGIVLGVVLLLIDPNRL